MKPIGRILTLLWAAALVTGCAGQLRLGGWVEGSSNASVATIDNRYDQSTSPSRPLYQLMVAELALQRGQISTALSYYMRVAQSSRDARIAKRASYIAISAGRLREASQTAQLWGELEPDNLEVIRFIAALLIRQGKLRQALPYLQQIASLQSYDHAKSGYAVASTLLSRAVDKKQAFSIMGQLLVNHKDDADTLATYSRFALRAGDYKAALLSVDEALALAPLRTDLVTMRSNILQMLGDTSAARDYLHDLLRAHPENVQYRRLYARLLLNSDALKLALDQYRILEQQLPEEEEVLFSIGLLLFEFKEYDAAQAYLERLSRHGRLAQASSYYLGWIAEQKKDTDTAMQYYAAVTRGGNYIAAQIRYAALLSARGEWREMSTHLSSVRTKNAAEKQTLYLAEGALLLDAGRYEAALSIYSKALNELPGNNEVLYARAMVAEKLGYLDVLEQDLRKILKQDPANVDALNALGYTLADRTNRYSEAHDFLVSALRIQPNSYYVIDSMGWLQYRMGNYDDALKYLRRALEIENDTEIKAHLIEVLWAMGEQEKARSEWAKAIKDTPDSEVLRDVMRQIEK
ncbi:MAG: tetratricopeptide repeat protein [Gammaproteobacteria bacterium]|nr:tetratricopeptide repeat protein [Gammaproteobacteria bacterium]